MKIGYARESTGERNLDAQIEFLKKEGCEEIMTDKCSLSETDRPGMEKLKNFLRKGDMVVVCRLDILGVNLKQTIELINEFQMRDVNFRTINENLDTTTEHGKITFKILFDFEKNRHNEKTKIESRCRLKSKEEKNSIPESIALPQIKSIRKLKLNDASINKVITLYRTKKATVKNIAKMMHITPQTVYKYINQSSVC